MLYFPQNVGLTNLTTFWQYSRIHMILRWFPETSKKAIDVSYAKRNLKLVMIFFSIWVFFHKHSRFTGQQGKGEDISFSPLYHFYPLHRHSDICREITAVSMPLHIANSRTWIGDLWFPSASRQPLNYALFIIYVTILKNRILLFSHEKISIGCSTLTRP